MKSDKLFNDILKICRSDKAKTIHISCTNNKYRKYAPLKLAKAIDGYLKSKQPTRASIVLEMRKVYESSKGCALLPNATIEDVLGKYADVALTLINGEEG